MKEYTSRIIEIVKKAMVKKGASLTSNEIANLEKDIHRVIQDATMAAWAIGLREE